MLKEFTDYVMEIYTQSTCLYGLIILAVTFGTAATCGTLSDLITEWMRKRR